MQLHVFEQLFFHNKIFYLYFWSFFVTISVLLNVSWYQWIGFMEDCGFDGSIVDNSSRFQSIPIRAKEVPDPNGCWFYSDNVSVANLNSTFVLPVFQCIHHYSKHAAYT